MIQQMLNRDAMTGAIQDLLASVKYGSLEDDPEMLTVMTALQTAAVLAPGELSAKDRGVFIPTQETISLLQAMLEELAESGELESADDRASTIALEPLRTSRKPPLATQQLVERHPDGSSDEGWGDFNLTDAQWAKVLTAMAATHAKRSRFELAAAEPEPYELADDARVILVGDWGNGGADAVQVATAIRGWMASAGTRECHVIHLGDVYYAGTRWEAQHRFLNCWPVHEDESRRYRSWTLNGNHDMYAAGEGLMDVTLVDPRFSSQRTTEGQPTTQFHLRGTNWQILGADSAWKYRNTDLMGHHGHLGQNQVDWVARGAADQRSGTILLTHHQPFSRKQAFPAPLRLERHFLGETLDIRTRYGIEAWFWGHEHRCITYDQPDGIIGLGYAACVGHGAMPEPPGEDVAGPNEWELLTKQPNPDIDGEYWRMCGFAVLDFSKDSDPEVTYLDQFGKPCLPTPFRIGWTYAPAAGRA